MVSAVGAVIWLRKKAKLLDQFHTAEVEKVSDIFQGVAIHVNGLTRPPADALKDLMAAHGGEYHMYQASSTTHIIASNLPNVKIKQLGTVPIVKPSWITESIAMGKLLDYKRYLLYTNQSTSQPRIGFPVIEKPVENKPAKMGPDCEAEPSTSKASSDPKHRGPTKTASDPKFLEEFYSNSRLHLISTLGAEYKQLVSQMRDRSDGKFPGKETLVQTKGKKTSCILTDPVIMHIDMDCFFVSVGLRDHPELHGKPVAITHAVEASSPLTPIAGPTGSRIKLCPELKTLPYDFEGYKEVSHALYKTIASYTLDIEAMSCDEMYGRRYGRSQGDGPVRRRVGHAYQERNYDGFGANRLQARLATRKAKPSGQYHLQADDVELYMSEIPLADLPGVGMATLSKLRNLGLNTCGDVQVAPLRLLQSELGQKAGETLKEQARGVDKRPLNFHQERKSVSAEALDECYGFLQSLSNEVYNRLNDIGMRARCLTLKLLVRAADAPVETAKFLGCGVCDSLTKSTSNLLINSPEVIFREVRVLYDKLNPPFVDLRGVGIQLTKLEKNAPLSNALSNFLRQAPVKKTDRDDKGVAPVVKADSEPVAEIVTRGVSKSKEVVKSKRGRPKGIRNAVVGRTQRNVDGSASLNKYFGKDKATNREKTQTQRTTPVNEEIDLEVLNELPEELRREIIKEYGLESKVKDVPSSSCPKREDNKKNADVLEKINEAPPRNETGDGRAKRSPFSNLTWDQIKPVIKEWIRSSETPAELDVEMLAEHFKNLAIDREIEILKVVFNFLHRTFSSLNCSWHRAYFTIVNVTQEGMVARYGRTLMVQRSFKCCRIRPLKRSVCSLTARKTCGASRVMSKLPAKGEDNCFDTRSKFPFILFLLLSDKALNSLCSFFSSLYRSSIISALVSFTSRSLSTLASSLLARSTAGRKFSSGLFAGLLMIMCMILIFLDLPVFSGAFLGSTEIFCSEILFSVLASCMLCLKATWGMVFGGRQIFSQNAVTGFGIFRILTELCAFVSIFLLSLSSAAEFSDRGALSRLIPSATKKVREFLSTVDLLESFGASSFDPSASRKCFNRCLLNFANLSSLRVLLKISSTRASNLLSSFPTFCLSLPLLGNLKGFNEIPLPLDSTTRTSSSTFDDDALAISSEIFRLSPSRSLS
ncbi:hypothetical protein NQ318_014989 [Aromia moschata]|uniref:DNA repair protein REV1 n=1 Tax=Aromia moschata TaxID=1265417 RepID=A0AAV8YYR1_9CUCU|nr:hypothetical protein NQ318_014989 [Aromia moschata]